MAHRGSHVSFRMPADLRKQLERAALASHRNVSEQIIHYVRKGLQDEVFVSTKLDEQVRMKL